MTKNEAEMARVVEAAKKYGVGRLYLVGSSLEKSAAARDLDLAVEDMPQGSFFKFYGEVMRIISRPVDVINLSGRKTLFKEMVKMEGKVLYERKAA